MGLTAVQARGLALDQIFQLSGEPGGDQRQVVSVLSRHDGVELTVRASRIPLSDRGYWLLLEDVTESEALRRERQWLAFHEPITGLPNQRAFEGRLQRTLAQVRDDRRAHVFGHIEIDDLEAVRETIGPAASDELIRQVVQALRGVLQTHDLLARLDEVRFGVLIRDDEGTGPDDWAVRLRRAVGRFCFQWQHENYTLGATVGLVPISASAGDVREIIAAAEAATASTRGPALRPRQGGAGSVSSARASQVEVSASYEDLRWLSRLHRALKGRRFELVRQAIVPTTAPDGAPVPMFEVLLRVVGQDGRLLPPAPFIHAAEKFHLIGRVDRWVVREALRRLAALPPSATWAITVNVSGVSLSEAKFLDEVLAVFDQTGAAADRVCFEITETAAVGNLRRARRFVSKLRRLGCRFILDDFGSGLSSFAYLEDLDVDFLKIDGRFVLGMTSDPISRAIVTAVHQVAEAMGIATIAECVESPSVRASLASLGVGYVQGYGIHRPEPWR